MLPPPQDFNEVLEWLLDADRAFPVIDWRIAEIDIWPLARAMIAVALQEDIMARKPEAAGPSDIGPRAARLRDAQAAARTRRGESWRGKLELDEMNSRGKDAPLEADDVDTLNANRLPDTMFDGVEGPPRWLFVSNANLSQAIGGRATHRFFDPVAEEAARAGVSSAILISSPLLPDDRLARTRHCGMADSLYELRRQARDVTEPVILPELERFAGAVSSPSVERVLQRPVLEAAARNLVQYAAALGELIEAWQITAVFTIPYASQLGVALCAAGRKRGVPVIDIQHGLIGAPNPHYKLASREGFNTLPTHVWLWSDANIDKPEMGSATASLVGGNPAYALVASERRSYPEWALAKQEGQKEVLVTLSSAQIPAWMPGVIAQAPKSWRWWVRLHPAAFDRANGRTAAIEELELMPNVELRRALELPLAILIEIADIHLTEGSSSALEARDAGLRTLFYDKVGYRYFEGLPGAEGDRFCEPDRLTAMMAEVFQEEAARERRATLDANVERVRRGVERVLSLTAEASSPPVERRMAP